MRVAHRVVGVIVQQVVLPEARRAQIPFADEVAQLRAVVGIADGGDAVDVRGGGAGAYSTATKYAQARLLFDECHNMIKQSPALSKHIRKRKSDLYYIPTMSKLQPLSRNSDSLDGLNASFVIMDELHGVKDRSLYEVMRQSQSARRKLLLVMITTAGTVRECIFDDMYNHACEVADGVISDDTFLPVLYELDKRDEWTDPDAWAKANPSLGAIKKLDDLQTKVQRAKQNPVELSGVLCKEFNIRETVKTAWLSFDAINNTETFDLEAFRGAYCIGGVDLSITTDLTCASLLFMRRGDDKSISVKCTGCLLTACKSVCSKAKFLMTNGLNVDFCACAAATQSIILM